MKQIICTIFICAFIGMNAQVGINTEDPKATLDVVGEPDVTTTMDGVIPPRITADQLSAKTYSTDQTGATVYVTAEPDTAFDDTNIQTEAVLEVGPYFFDGERWLAVKSTADKDGRCAKATNSFPSGDVEETEITVGNYSFMWVNRSSAGGNRLNHIEAYKHTPNNTYGLTEYIGGGNAGEMMADPDFDNVPPATWTRISDGFNYQEEHSIVLHFVTEEPEVYELTIVGGRRGTGNSYICLSAERLYVY